MTRLPAAAYPASLPVSLMIALSFFVLPSGSAKAETASRPAVEINLDALKSSPQIVTAPTRIIDGETVIILTPPSLQKKAPPTPPKKIVRPLTKPSLKMPDTKLAAVKPVPVPPVNPAKLPDTADEKKFGAVTTPVIKMDTAPIPTPAKAQAMKAEIAEDAVAKMSDTASEQTPPAPEAVEPAKIPGATVEATAEKDEEIKLAAIAPSAGPAVAATSAGSPDNLVRILFAENAAELPDDARSSLQAIADELKDSGRENVQLLAYGSGASVSAARRLSLGRALSVRSRLMELGVDNRQIEVRALGEPEGGGPSDRVDLILITR